MTEGTGDVIKYITGCEVSSCMVVPAGWQKWEIPAQTYLAERCTPDETGEVFSKIKNNPNIKILGVGYEYYPEPDDNGIVDVYIPVAAGMLFCQSCGIPMTKPEDFGTETDGSPNNDYCRHCFPNGEMLKDITLDSLTADVQKLIDIENKHPGLLSTPLLNEIKVWLFLENGGEKAAAVPDLLAALIDGQDCDFTGTQWEKEWLADGKVCHCLACVAARKCISDIKNMKINF